jgi:serine/threonine protein kinase
MDRYSYSLKDLLELPLPGHKESGYKILASQPHGIRVREALLILKGAADGLEQLHNVVNSAENIESFFHRDIKPGNIFIKAFPDRLGVALGDLGNLNDLPSSSQNLGPQGSLSYLEEDFAPGTQHYRSPEQKYYKDVADARVIHIPENNLEETVKRILEESDQADDIANHDSNASTKKRVVLIIQEPKFKNTLIEEEDIVILSKDTDRRQLMIDKIMRPNDNKNQDYSAQSFVCVLDADCSRVKQDEKTQVEFYKKQRFRTDLFGIGAVVFDIITIGWSPEKFYEMIRKYEGHSVEYIVNRYDTLTKGEIGDENLDFAEIFRPFRNENDPALYPETDIIEFILKCMLYQSEGTFYQEAEESYEASRELRSKIEELQHKYITAYPSLPPTKSVIIHKLEPKIERTGPIVPFNQRIEMLQGFREWSGLDKLEPALIVANRLMYGAYYFWRIVDLVRKIIPTGDQSGRQEVERIEFGENSQETHRAPISNPESLVLHQILPTYISLELPAEGNIGEAKLHLARLSIDLRKELRDNRLELLIRSPVNPFVPNEIAGMRREIRLRFLQKQEQSSLDKFTCKYRFRDVATVRRDLSKGDWIVDNRSRLWRIAEDPEPYGDELEIELYNPEGKDFTFDDLVGQDSGQIDATYFSEINPVKYYLEILGLYLQHLIFTWTLAF